MTLGREITQGTLQGTLLCSEGCSALFSAAVNNNKAIIFYSSFGVIALFLGLGSHRQRIFFLSVSSLLPQTSFADKAVAKK